MINQEVMQRVFDALDYAADSIGCANDDDIIGIARKELRTALAQREWVGLTDDEIEQLELMEDEEEERKGWCDLKLLIAWTEAKLKEKNNG